MSSMVGGGLIGVDETIEGSDKIQMLTIRLQRLEKLVHGDTWRRREWPVSNYQVTRR